MISFLLVFASFAFLAEDTISVTTENGKKINLTFNGLTERFLVVNEQPSRIPLDQIDKIVFQRELKSNPKDGSFAIFAEGDTIIRAARFFLEGESLKVEISSNVPTISIPRSRLQRIQPIQEKNSNDWRAVLEKKIQSDALIVLRNGRLDMITGIIKSLNHDTVEFESRGKTADIPLSKIAGLKFFQPEIKSQKFKLIITDVFSNQYSGNALAISNGTISIRQNTQNENLGQLAISIPLHMISEIDLSARKFIQLQNLEPDSKFWLPFLESQVEDQETRDLLRLLDEKKPVWSKNQCFGVPLKLDFPENRSAANPVGRKTYQKGIAVEAGGGLVYMIPNNAVSFESDVGIQSIPNQKGSVKLSIKIDGQTVYEKNFSSNDRKATMISLPIHGDRMTISAGYSNEGPTAGFVVFGNPKFKVSK